MKTELVDEFVGLLTEALELLGVKQIENVTVKTGLAVVGFAAVIVVGYGIETIPEKIADFAVETAPEDIEDFEVGKMSEDSAFETLSEDIEAFVVETMWVDLAFEMMVEELVDFEAEMMPEEVFLLIAHLKY